MKSVKKILNATSDDVDKELDEVREQSQNENDDFGNASEEDVEEREEGDEDEENEGDEVSDNEDYIEEKGTNPDNMASQATPRQSLGGGNKTIVLKKPGKSQSKSNTATLVNEAIKELKERSGSSLEAIKKYILNKKPDINVKRLRGQIKRYIKLCLDDGSMVQIKRSFKLTKKHEMKQKQLEREKRTAKEKKAKIKAIEKKKQNGEKLKEKMKEAKKKSTSEGKDKDNDKAIKRPNVQTKDTKAKPAKKQKLEKASIQVGSKMSSEKPLKVKNKLSRKSINLVVRPTPPRPKTMKKTKTTTTSSSKNKIEFPSAKVAPTLTTSSATKASRRPKKK